eukprot:COSAG01_NODE_10028_length_2271_cov_3.372468_4_plen_132_part_00
MSLHRYNVGNHRLDPGGRDRSRQSDKSKAFKINSIDGDPSAWLTRNNWRSDPKLGLDRELRREMQVCSCVSLCWHSNVYLTCRVRKVELAVYKQQNCKFDDRWVPALNTWVLAIATVRPIGPNEQVSTVMT